MAVGTALRRSKNLRGLAETRWPWGPVARRQLGPQAGAPGRCGQLTLDLATWWEQGGGDCLGPLPQAGAETDSGARH